MFQPNDDFDYIIAMDQSNVENIKQINPNIKGQLYKLLDFSDMDETDVPDPYYTNNFEGVYKMVQSSCDNLINFIIKDANLREG
ncbi:low molecular weight phosphotyrosine protein phosphatase [Staphylococcus aureus]|nr:low molecular weight phosphotyrosine protein phosphatase [Staphylococcus aureus]